MQRCRMILILMMRVIPRSFIDSNFLVRVYTTCVTNAASLQFAARRIFLVAESIGCTDHALTSLILKELFLADGEDELSARP
jgi:hypothetical protein